MKALIATSLLLVIILVSLSAYLRLAHSGIGCADWPQCYGRIGVVESAVEAIDTQSAYQRLVEQSGESMAWATPAHRLVASVLGLLVFFLVFLALRQKKHRLASTALLGLTVFLAVLGIRSGGLHNPAIVMGNLAGGFTMLALLGWMMFSDAPRSEERGALPVVLVILGIVLLGSQILLGGLTSANFAATSCQTLPDCHGSYWPGEGLSLALDLSREHEVTPSGQAIGGTERLAIHKTHRLGALLTLVVLLLTGFMAFMAGGRMRVTGSVIILLIILEFSAGIAAVISDLPISLAVAHNWLAGLLLLSLLKLAAQNRQLTGIRA